MTTLLLTLCAVLVGAYFYIGISIIKDNDEDEIGKH